MIFCKAVAVDWEKVQQERNKTITASNSRENKMRIAKDYKVGDQVLIVLDADERRSQPKMDRPTRGPFEVIQVHNNGTVTIDRGNFSETINIRRIKPYHIG
jgi:hypothetical protein